MGVFETSTTYMVTSTVTKAGRGVSRADIDWMSDRLHNLVVDRDAPAAA